MPATGFPFPDQGYGTHLWGGNHSRIEGPAIHFDESTGYYYLFVTYGGLDAAEGYSIRVARATSPQGPYLDAEGRDMAEVKSDPSLPIFDDATIAESAVKLMGNHRFAPSDANSLTSGYVSPGGSSPFVHAESGERMLVFHSRFPGLGEAHQLRVHEWTIDADGWPVIAPLRYAGEPDREPRADDIPGTYTLVDHAPRTISRRLAEPEEVTLSEDGSVSGTRTGTWEADGETRLLLSIDGDEVRAELGRHWDPRQDAWVTTFTGLAEPGVAVWGVRQR